MLLIGNTGLHWMKSIVNSCLSPVWFVVIVIFAMVGCQADLFEAQRAYQNGDVASAATQITAYRKQVGNNQHAVIALLESGSILQAANDLEASSAALEEAEAKFETLDDNQAGRAGDEVLSALTNPQEVAYLGKPYDRVMSPIYRAINLMAAGSTAEARQAFFASQNWQARAINHYEKLIDEADAELTDKQKKQSKRVQEDEQLQQKLQDIYGDLDIYEAYEGYSNPFADMLFAVYLMGTQTDRSDGELARNHMRRVAGMNPGNTFVAGELDRADDASKGNKQAPAVHVFFMTGTAPSRSEINIGLPLFLVVGGGNLNYAGVAFPQLEFNDRYVKRAVVKSRGEKVETQLIADFDRIVGAAFKADLPVQITRTIVGAIAKASAAYGINKAAQGENDTVHTIAQIATFLYQAAQNQADKRTWATLPKQVQYARVPIPAAGNPVKITGPNGGMLWEAQGLSRDRTHLVLIRSIVPGTQPWVTHVELQ